FSRVHGDGKNQPRTPWLWTIPQSVGSVEEQEQCRLAWSLKELGSALMRFASTSATVCFQRLPGRLEVSGDTVKTRWRRWPLSVASRAWASGSARFERS